MIPAIDDIIINGPIKEKWVESEATLRATQLKYSEDLHNLLKALVLELKIAPTECVIRVSDGDEFIIVDSAFDPARKDETVSVTIAKKGTPFFLTDKGFANYLELSNRLASGTIRLYFIQEPFQTGDAYYIPWSSILSDPRVKYDKLGDPTIFVRGIGEKAVQFLPKFAENWISSDGISSGKCDPWSKVASLKLLSILCDDIQIDGSAFIITFKGDRTKTLKIDAHISDDLASLKFLFPLINEITKWIYLEEKHIATKLTFLHQHLSYSLLDDKSMYKSDDLRRIFSSAFDGARLSFEYFLKNISKDVLKNMSDLSKALLDNQAKIKQNISDLSTTMWKDFTTVFGVIVLQFAIKQNDLVAKYFPVFGWGLILYVAISYSITAFNGFEFYYDTRASITDSWPRIYSYMDAADMKRGFFDPLRNSFVRFRGIFWIVLLAYLALVVFILNLIPDVQQFIGNITHKA